MASAPPLIWLKPAPEARRSLSRQTVVAAGIRVADRGGAAALTMSAVAGELGSYTAMALYRYVDSKDGLVDLMLDDVIGEVPLPDIDPASGSADWRAMLRRLELDTWEMVGRHLWYAELVYTRPPLGPNTMHRTEAGLAVLTGVGPGLADALGYLALLDRHVFSSAVLAAQERSAVRAYGIDDDAGLMATVRQLSDVVAASGHYPLLAQWMTAPEGPSTEEHMIMGLDFLLDGITRRIEGEGHAPRR